MDDRTDTVIGAAAHRSRSPQSASPFQALAKRDPDAEATARKEANEIARALAAQAIARAQDSDAGEYMERLQTLARTIWPQDPLGTYTLQSSLGAYLVARLAMSWAPPTETALRREPLKPDGFLMTFHDYGIPDRVANALIAEWPGIDEGFVPDQVGLGPQELAGLAERTLSVRENNRALSQVAYSPRCLARLATTLQVMLSVRTVLPVLPPEDAGLGAAWVTAMAAMALDRPQRALELLGHRPNDPMLRALAELAEAQVKLTRGDAPNLADDDRLAVPESDEGAVRKDDVPSETELAAVTAPQDPLDIVRGRIPSPTRWPRNGTHALELDTAFLALWRDGRQKRRSRLAELGSLLGLRALPPPPWAPAVGVPPDTAALRALLGDGESAGDVNANTANTERISIGAFMGGGTNGLEISSHESLFPAVRGALRAIARAPDGKAPTHAAIAAAGDLGWALRRARAIALTVRGELAGAIDALEPLGAIESPEARWTRARLARFGERPAEPVPPQQARPLAALLVSDLCSALGRTVSGTLA